tara:strand:+ start:13164 stop:14324 length:1161 start_codon:yes stop_codon:yes gene_type:complete
LLAGFAVMHPHGNGASWMNIIRIKTLIGAVSALLISLLLTTQGYAYETTFSGFLSVAGGMTLDDGDEYLVDPSRVDDARFTHYDNEFRINRESIVGLQSTTIINDKMRAVVQVSAKSNNSWDPSLSWIYVNYEINPELDVQVGRFRLPLFYYSDFLDVGLAYTWIRPPIDLYHVPTTESEGLKFTYNKMLTDDIQFVSQLWITGGDEKQTVANVNTVYTDVDDALGINASLIWPNFSVRAVYSQNKRDTTISVMNYSTFPATTLTQKMLNDIEFRGLAFTVDEGNFLSRNEYINFSIGQASAEAWYVSGGYMWDDYTFMLTQSRKDGFDRYNNYADLTSDTTTLGVNYSVNHSAALKFEYSHQTTQLAADPEESVDLLAVALDVVF